MKSKVGIAELKAHLSEYVRAAQKGKEVIIKDRETPVAKLAPLEPAHRFLRVIPATRSMAEVERMLDESAERAGSAARIGRNEISRGYQEGRVR